MRDFVKEALKEDIYKTNSGDEITFGFEEDVERENRGWVVHLLEAYVNGNQAGYLKISYIPEREWDRRYTDNIGFIRWAKHIGSKIIISRSNIGNLDAMNYSLSRELDQPRNWLLNNKEDYESLSYFKREDMFKEYLDEFKKRNIGEYEKDERFHVDKPLVDYITVDPEYRRRGIGFALYKKGAKIMANRFDLNLYASGIQTDMAKGVWKKLQRKLPIKKERYDHPIDGMKTRIMISYN